MTAGWTVGASAALAGGALVTLVARSLQLSHGRVSREVMDIAAGVMVIGLVGVTVFRFWVLA